MRNHFKILAVDLQRELANLERLQAELFPLLPAPGAGEPSGPIVRAIASILHDFYGGVERLFRRVAEGMDGEIPRGENWHIELLQRMTVEVPEVRPVVVSTSLVEDLEGYLRFRHVFRNTYGYQLRWGKFSHLATAMAETLRRFEDEMAVFIECLRDLES